MSSIQLGNSPYSSNTFSVQSAAAAFHHILPGGILFSQGCNVIGPRNCTTACQDPAQIFKTPYTLQNCMVLSALVPSNWMQPNETSLSLSNWMQPNETSLSLSNWTQPLSTDALGIAIEFGIDTTKRDFPSLASNVTQTIKGCLGQYCENNPNCPTKVAEQDSISPDLVMFWPWYSDYRWATRSDLTNSSPVYNMTCPPGGALNPDIGGIGVSHGFAPPKIKSPPEVILE